MILVGIDQQSWKLHSDIIRSLAKKGVEYAELPETGKEEPVLARGCALAVSERTGDLGILVLSGGFIANVILNRHEGVFAGICHDPTSVAKARASVPINTLILPKAAVEGYGPDGLVDAFLSTEPRGTTPRDMENDMRGSDISSMIPKIVGEVLDRVRTGLDFQTPRKRDLPVESASRQTESPSQKLSGAGSPFPRKLITEDDVRIAVKEGKKTLLIGKKTIITPSARDLAGDRRIEFEILKDFNGT